MEGVCWKLKVMQYVKWIVSLCIVSFLLEHARQTSLLVPPAWPLSLGHPTCHLTKVYEDIGKSYLRIPVHGITNKRFLAKVADWTRLTWPLVSLCKYFFCNTLCKYLRNDVCIRLVFMFFLKSIQLVFTFFLKKGTQSLNVCCWNFILLYS
jgi:hypothetical protein